jgi:hypothetical protein
LNELLQVLLVYSTIKDGERDQHFSRERIQWELHVANLIKEGAFNKMYRMSIHAFRYLFQLLDPYLYVDPIMSTLRTNQPIIGTEIILSSFIRWTSAGSFHDIRVIAGISISSFYQVMDKCARTIIDCDALAYSFPKTPEEIQKAASGLEALSTNNFLRGCVGAVDGWVIN